MSAWANRKAAVLAEAEALEAAKQQAVIDEQHAALAEKTEDEVLAELELPNPDEMQAGDDFTAFMKASVPDALRNRALRTLWRSNPVLANVDMLVDYGEDFTGKNDVLGVVKTIYRVGKGMLPDKEEDAEEGEVKPTPTAKETSEEDTSEMGTLEASTEDEAPDEAPDEAQAADLVEVVAPAQDIEEAPYAPMSLAPRRRMRFEFAQGDAPAATGTEI